MYYGSFVIVAVFVVVNLFIAVVLNNLDEIREEDRQAALQAPSASGWRASPIASSTTWRRCAASWTGWRRCTASRPAD